MRHHDDHIRDSASGSDGGAQVVVVQHGDAGRILPGKDLRLDAAQRDKAKAHPLDLDHHRLHGLGVIHARPHRQDIVAAQHVQRIAESPPAIAAAGGAGAVHDVVGRHAHQVKAGVCHGRARARVAGEHVGEDAAGVRRSIRKRGVERAHRQIRAADQLAHLGIDIIRIPPRVDGSLHAARRDDHTGEEQGDAGRD